MIATRPILVLLGVCLLTVGATPVGATADAGAAPATTVDGSAAVDGTGQTWAQGNDTLVVDGDADGDSEYATIQAAVNAATDGDRIEVRPGTYHETVHVRADVELVAPNGATLDGSTLTTTRPGIALGTWEGATPIVAGFTVQNYTAGFYARSLGDWTLRNATVRGNRQDGVDARGSTGDWTIADTTVRDNGRHGVNTAESEGNWTVEHSTVRGNGRYGIDARLATGDWTVRETTVTDDGSSGVNAAAATGDWTIERTNVTSNGLYSVFARWTTGDWTIRRTVLDDAPLEHVYAEDASGHWTVTRSVVDVDPNSVDPTAIEATNATVRGDAGHNWWGRAGSGGRADCTGNVTCTPVLAGPPAAGVGSTTSAPVVGNAPATDPDGDGVYEDVNGDGGVDLLDVAVLYSNRNSAAVTANGGAFDVDGSGGFDLIDVSVFYGQVTGSP